MSAQGQKAALKTNVLYDAFMNINVGMEVGLAPRWTLDITGDFNAWTLSHDRRWKHWIVQPEARLWFCDRFAGHFLGFHAHGGQYNAGGLKTASHFWGPISRNSPTTAIRAGSSAPVQPTDMPGYWDGTGTWKPRSAWATHTPDTTGSAA